MKRQKVNGNRIRSAGNPDAEPDLSHYPICPPAPAAKPQSQPQSPLFEASDGGRMALVAAMLRRASHSDSNYYNLQSPEEFSDETGDDNMEYS